MSKRTAFDEVSNKISDAAMFQALNMNIDFVIKMTMEKENARSQIIKMISDAIPKFNDQSYIDHCNEQLRQFKSGEEE